MQKHSIRRHACILNTGPAAWLFGRYAQRLSQALEIDVSTEPRTFNYILGVSDNMSFEGEHHSFIPYHGIEIASDKRIQAKVFYDAEVQTPETYLLKTDEALESFLAHHPEKQWCLKYPLSCGAAGHHLISPGYTPYPYWPLPYVVQEFIALKEPMVYRAYGYGGFIRHFTVRSIPPEKPHTPWVAHAQGAVYKHIDEIPSQVCSIALRALRAADLFHSYGVVDLLRDESGAWWVLEVGTDGICTHVDDEMNDPQQGVRHFANISTAFWQWCEWGY
jgi:hypothetical protein